MTIEFGETVISLSWLMFITLFLIALIVMRMVSRRIGRWRVKRMADDEKTLSATEMAHIRSPAIVPTLRLHGPILASADDGSPLGGVTYADAFVRRLSILKKAPAVQGLIIDLNTPGGSVPGSEMIRTAIAEFAEQKPVFIHVTEMAASGGMWVLSALDVQQYPDRVFASPGALLGSVGVVGPTLMQYSGITRMSGLLGSGIEAETIDGEVLSAGPGKAFGHPFADKADQYWSKLRFQELLESTRERFIKLLVKTRQVDEDVFSRNGIGASVVTAEEAARYGFVDGLISRPDLEAMVRGVLKLDAKKLLFLTVSRKRGGRLRRFMESSLLALGSFEATSVDAQLKQALNRERVLILDQAHLYGI